MRLSENPVIRMLAVIVVVSAGIRLIYELLRPVWTYLLAALVLVTALRLLRWWRERW